MLLVMAREQKPKGSSAAAEQEWVSPGCANPDACRWDRGSGTELRVPSLASPGRAARREKWQQPGDGTLVLAGSLLLLEASISGCRKTLFF